MSIDVTSDDQSRARQFILLLVKIKSSLDGLTANQNNQRVENVVTQLASFKRQITVLLAGQTWADQKAAIQLAYGWNDAKWTSFETSVTALLDTDLPALFTLVFNNQGILLGRTFNDSANMVVGYETPLNAAQRAAVVSAANDCLANYQ